MTQLQTQIPEYWASPNFVLTDDDVERIYNFLLEVEEPQTIDVLAKVVIEFRVAEEQNELKRRLDGRTVYQPRNKFAVGDKLVFPAMQFAQGDVVAVRDATNPHLGTFKSIEVNFIDQSKRNAVCEFAAELDIVHPLNQDDELAIVRQDSIDPERLFALYGEQVAEFLREYLANNDEFIRLANQWFVKGLLADVNVGHLHLSEAVLEVSGGGPLLTKEILVHLDMDASIPESVQEFSLNYGLLNDKRFDEVAPIGRVAWFLHRLEPAAVRETPERLNYQPISFDRALLGSQLTQIEREIDDEWSDIESIDVAQTVTFIVSFPHRAAGTIPLSSRIRPLFPLGVSRRQLVTLIDDQSGDEIPTWVVGDGRYLYGLQDWYEKHRVPVGGFITLTPTGQPGRVLVGVNRRRRERKEWVRLAHVEDGRLRFELKKRGIGCDYDDLMIVGTDSLAAVDLLFRQTKTQQRPLTSILAEIFPDLGRDGAQNSVHAKTLYSAVNLLRRIPPGVIFAELVRHPAFVSVGDQYWQFEPSKLQN